MKFAILADIHANRIAMETVIDHIERWRPDVVIVAGDVVNRGPKPAGCLRRILEKQRAAGWLCLRGNHEDYVLLHTDHTFSGPQGELYQNSLWTYEQLDRKVSALEAWPFSLSLSVWNSELRVAHASMRHRRDGIYVETSDEQLREQIGRRPPAIFVVGHTHKPLIRQLIGTQVVNVGSVGLPFDGDPRACYAQVIRNNGEWQTQLIRLDCDREQADRDFVESGLLEGGGPLTRLMRVELRLARSQIAEWVTVYEKAVLADELSAADSVTKFLESEGLLE